MTEPALLIEGLHKTFRGLIATNNVTMRVEPGERRLLIGPNGAGKTTLFNQITGDLKPNAGHIALFGAAVTKLPPHRRAHMGLARTYQILTLFPRENLLRNIALALLGLRASRWNMVRSLAKDRGLHEEAAQVLARVGLDRLAERPVAALSYGEKRRLEIALALAQNPRLLLLDEPLAGLSTEERETVRHVIATIPRSTTLLLIEHDMDIALDLADTVTLLQFGTVIVDGTRDEVIADPRTREVYLGE
jgi:branched-chain amino acid transport system ATP-binding protein